jgi:hypothetical protein
VQGEKEPAVLEELLMKLTQHNLLKTRGQQRTDSTHILAAVRPLNRVAIVGETMRRALNELAEVVPGWVKAIAKPEWVERYECRFLARDVAEAVLDGSQRR